MKGGGKEGVSKDLQPVAASPRPLEGLRARMSLESNASWTDRMLEAVANGVKGNKWYSRMDKVWNPTHLQMGAWQVIRNEGAQGVDHRSCEQLEKELHSEVALLERGLREGT